MKNLIKLLFAVGLFVFIAIQVLFDDGPGTHQQTTVQQAPQSTLPPPAQNAPQNQVAHMLPEIPGNVPWPFLKEGGEAIGLADSLTQKNFVLVLDGSGSMKKVGCSGDLTKIEVAKQAVTEWANSVPDNANIGLIVFDHHAFSIRLPLGVGNREQFRAEVDKVVADYKTPLTKSLNTAYEMLTEQGRRQLGYGDFTVVIVTDGAADNIEALKASVDFTLTTSPIMIHTIGFCLNSEHTLNNTGRTVYRSANNPAELRQGLQEVLAESASFDIAGFE